MPVASVYLDRQPNVIGSHRFVDGHDGLDIWQTQLVVSWQHGVHIPLVALKALSKDSCIFQARVEALAQSRGHGVCCITQKHCLQDTKDFPPFLVSARPDVIPERQCRPHRQRASDAVQGLVRK